MKGTRNLKTFFLGKNTLLTFNAVLLCAIILLSLLIIRDMFPPSIRNRPSSAPASLPVTDTDALQKIERYAVILTNNPFGFDAGKLVPLSSVSGKKEQVPVSNYKLIGTITSGDRDSFAVFQAEGKQLLFRVNAVIPGLGTLVKVKEDRVTIRGDRVFDMTIAEVRGIERVIPVSAPAPGAGDQFVRRAGDGSYVLNERMVQESINNPQRLMTDARLVPSFREGKQEGFMLSEVKAGGIYDSLGLRNGDVLLRINEYNITNPESALQAFTALRGVERLQLDIMRNNAPVSMNYLIK